MWIFGRNPQPADLSLKFKEIYVSQLIIPGLVSDATESETKEAGKKLYRSDLSVNYINKLCDKAELIEIEDAKEADALGYMARSLVQTALPHSDPKTNEFTRINGHYMLTMLAPSSVGIPFGSIPRIILAWITTEAIKTRNRQIYLGETMSRFIKKLGFNNNGGARGDIGRTKDQMNRLVQTHITCKYQKDNYQKIKNIQAISEMEGWWLPNSTGMWEAELILNQDFFDEITACPVPIDMRALKALKNSSLAIDIYCWLTYRMFTLRKPNTLITWKSLFLQFGTSYANDRKGRYAFKKNFISQLKKVATVYSNLSANIEENGLRLYKSLPHISPKPKVTTESNQKGIKETTKQAAEEAITSERLKRYETYKLDQLLLVIQALELKEQNQFTKAFDDYLSRRNLHKHRFSVQKDYVDVRTKRILFDFVNSQWHHLLSSIKTFQDFLVEFEA